MDFAFEERCYVNASVSIDNVIALVPRSNRTNANSTSAMEYSAYIITTKSANTLTKKNDFYIEALKAILPELFPIDLTQDSDGNFVEVTGNRGKSNKPKPFGPEEPPQQLSLNQSIALIKVSPVVSEITSNTRWVCTNGRGGNRAIGVYDNYYAKHNAKYVSQGISEGSVLRADNDAEGWTLVNIRIPGVDSPAKLRLFHMCIPHSETNLSPTWSDYDGETFHRHGAIAYTFCENDDQEMLEARMAVTFRLTGSYDGVIDKREYYHAYMAEFRSKLAAMNAPPTNKNDPPTHEQMDQDTEDEEEVPNSQEDNFAAPGQFDDEDSTDLNRTPQKKRKVSNPPPAPAAAAPIFAAPENPSESPVHVVMALPIIGTVVDVNAFFHQYHPGFGPGLVTLCRYAPFPECLSALIKCPDSDTANELCNFISTHAFFGKYKCSTQILSEDRHFNDLDTTVTPTLALERLSEDPLLHYVKYNTPADADMDLWQMMRTTTVPQEVLTYFMTNLKQEEDLMESKANPIQVPPTILDPTALEVEFEGNTEDYDEHMTSLDHDGQAASF
jgi:hypothetical protein